MNSLITPLDYYREQCAQGVIVEDPQQLVALQKLQGIYHELLLEQKRRTQVFSLLRKNKLVHGLYLWGGVGIGKTFLMDCFYHCIPFQNKIRVHFHQFMKYVHQELQRYQGQKDPLQIIATELASHHQLLCFDEFFVTDITDAMLLARLLDLLFSKGVCLVATSNVAPDDLYKRGLQREQFLPAIALLKKHTVVMHNTTMEDYRLRHLKNAGVFYAPNDSVANIKMEMSFDILTSGSTSHCEPLDLYGRPIKIRKQAGDVIWFDFHEICKVPRSQLDYLAISEKYSTVFISDIPVISQHSKDLILLFIRLVDVLYDARIRLVVSSADLVDKIYTQGQMLFEFNRTRSRLLEMQSEHYFSNAIIKN